MEETKKTTTDADATPPPYEPEAQPQPEPGLYQSPEIEAAAQAARETEEQAGGGSYPAFLYGLPRRSFWDE